MFNSYIEGNEQKEKAEAKSISLGGLWGMGVQEVVKGRNTEITPYSWSFVWALSYYWSLVSASSYIKMGGNCDFGAQRCPHVCPS